VLLKKLNFLPTSYLTSAEQQHL